MTNSIIQYVLYLVILVALAIPLGGYIAKVMNGEKVWIGKIISPVENLIYKILKVDQDEQMNWKKYAASVGMFSIFSFLLLFAILMCQGFLPWNPQKIPGMSPDLAFNTAVSFVTAGIQRRNWPVILFTDGRTYGAELCIRSCRNRSAVRTDPRIH